MALRLRVCRTDAVPPGELAEFEVTGLKVPILVANLNGRYLVTAAACPHEGVSLAEGSLCDTRVTCAAHGYEFDLATGRCTHDPALSLRRFQVTIAGGDVYVDLF